MNDEIVQKYVKGKLNDSSMNTEFALALGERIKNIACCQKKKFSQIETYAFCSLEEIRNFLNTGSIDELPEDYYGEISCKDRIEIVKSICNHPANYHLRLIKNEPHMHHGYPCLFITDRKGYITINKNDSKN
jgi:hypothetical protein